MQMEHSESCLSACAVRGRGRGAMMCTRGPGKATGLTTLRGCATRARAMEAADVVRLVGRVQGRLAAARATACAKRCILCVMRSLWQGRSHRRRFPSAGAAFRHVSGRRCRRTWKLRVGALGRGRRRQGLRLILDAGLGRAGQPWLRCRIRRRTRSSAESPACTAGPRRRRRPARTARGGTSRWGWGSRRPRRPSRATTSTRSAPSPATCPSAVAS